MFKHKYLNPENTLSRLKKEYDEHKSITVAVDFDNTLYDFHKEGLDCSELVDLVVKLKEINCYIIIWTANKDTEFVSNFLTDNKIPFDVINQDPPFWKNSTTRKIFYSELLDDRGGLLESFNRLTSLYQYAKGE